MSTNHAVVVDPEADGGLAVVEVDEPRPAADEAVVAVERFAANPGELMRARQVAPGWRPGRDFSGTVVRRADDGAGPEVGSRVFGMRAEPGVWAQHAAVPTGQLALVPDGVSPTDAAALGTAGLTALLALRRGGLLLGRSVLVSGATGAVGRFAVQLAARAGARAVGTVRRREDVDPTLAAGASAVVVGDDEAALSANGPYDLVLDPLGGEPLARALAVLAEEGLCVNIGWSAGGASTIDVSSFNRVGGATLYGFRLDIETRGRSTTAELAELARLVAEGCLTTSVEVEAPWTEVGRIAADVRDRRISGKAVLSVPPA